MKKNILLLFSVFCILVATAQEKSVFKIPKQYSFEIGYRNVFAQSNMLENNQATNGYGMMFDYAWQLSGFDGKKAKSFITVPLGYTIMMPDNSTSKSLHMLNYGWTVRHELSTNRKIVPFLGYGLLLNNMRVTDTEGSLFGHQTQFEVGTNFNTSNRLKYFAKLEYSYTSYPRFKEPERIRMHFVDLRVGVRF